MVWMYSPLFDALCHQCGQLLWGRVGGQNLLVPRAHSAMRNTNLFGVPPTHVITSGIFQFRNDLFANYGQYKRPTFPTPPWLHPASIGPLGVHDTPVWHSPTHMCASLNCSKYCAKYYAINYGYKLDGTTCYNIRKKIVNVTEYQKQQIALAALHSNTLDSRHR